MEFTHLYIYIVLGVYRDLPQPWTPYYVCTTPKGVGKTGQGLGNL
jgi:hypothetical protein